MKIPVKITDSAKGYLTDALTSNNKKYVHLSVSGGGCSWFQYNWDCIDEDKDGKVIDDILVLDNMAEMFVFGCTTLRTPREDECSKIMFLESLKV